MSFMCGVRRYPLTRCQNLLALFAICATACVFLFITAFAIKFFEAREWSLRSKQYYTPASEDTDKHFVLRSESASPHGRFEIRFVQRDVKVGLESNEFKQQADILRWVKTYVKSPDQLSVWDSRSSQETWHGTNQTDDTYGVLIVTETTVPGLYLHSNWHWTLTKRGEFDPTLYTPPERELPVQNLPGAIIIGAGMCGTRALLEYLNLHPNIVAETREMNFFSDNQKLARGIAWYKASMPLSYSDQVTIEKSPAYLPSWRAPAKIFQMDKTMKLILLVKDPVQRILTQAGKLVKRIVQDSADNHEHLYLNTKGLKPEVRNDSNTVSGGLYAKHLKRWLTYFPLQQIHIVEGLDLVSQPAREVYKLESFLGVPHVITADNFVYNSTKGFYCLAPVYSPHRARCLNNNKGVEHPRLQSWAARLLYDFYRPHNEEFFALIGRSFDWTLKQPT